MQKKYLKLILFCSAVFVGSLVHAEGEENGTSGITASASPVVSEASTAPEAPTSPGDIQKNQIEQNGTAANPKNGTTKSQNNDQKLQNKTSYNQNDVNLDHSRSPASTEASAAHTPGYCAECEARRKAQMNRYPPLKYGKGTMSPAPGSASGTDN